MYSRTEGWIQRNWSGHTVRSNKTHSTKSKAPYGHLLELNHSFWFVRADKWTATIEWDKAMSSWVLGTVLKTYHSPISLLNRFCWTGGAAEGLILCLAEFRDSLLAAFASLFWLLPMPMASSHANPACNHDMLYSSLVECRYYNLTILRNGGIIYNFLAIQLLPKLF